MPVAPVVERPAGSLPVGRTHRDDRPPPLKVLQPLSPDELPPQESDSAPEGKSDTPSSLDAPPTDALSPVRASGPSSAGQDLPLIDDAGDGEPPAPMDVPDDELGRVWTADPVNPFGEHRREIAQGDERGPDKLDTAYHTAFQYPFKSGARLMLIIGTLLFANAAGFWLMIMVPLFAPAGFHPIFTVFALVATLPVCLILAFFANFCLAIVADTAGGEEDAPHWPDFLDFWAAIIRPAFRLLVVASLPVCPSLVCLALRSRSASPAVGAVWAGLAVLFLIIGLAYTPMAILASTFFGSIASANPAVVVHAIRRTGLDYACAAGLIIGVAVMGCAVVAPLTLAMWAILFAGHWLLAILSAFPIFAHLAFCGVG